ncbi:MAG: ABC transporter permease [Acidobacteria bacterium]|nr:ABC transporter permease [Acidobacteriota bacterium]
MTAARMDFGDVVRQSFADLRQNKLRSALTMFGIAWGIASVVFLVALVAGFADGARKSMATLGRDLMIVWGGRTSLASGVARANRPIRLRFDDLPALARNPVIRGLSPEVVNWSARIAHLDKSAQGRVHGVAPSFQEIRSLTIDDGRFINERDVAEARNVAVLGCETKRRLFGGRRAAGEVITIQGTPFLVVGTMPKKEQHNMYYGPDDEMVIVPWTVSRQVLGNRWLDNLVIQPADIAKYDLTEKAVKETLGSANGFNPDDPQALPIWNTVKNAADAETLYAAIKTLMGAIGAVTLAIGGLGVMNIMLVSLAERVREIGLRKALGATRRTILSQFLAEAGILCGLSGALGMVLGWLLCVLVGHSSLPDGFNPPVINLSSLVIATLVLGGVTIASALYPAIRASRLNPVAALRYE